MRGARRRRRLPGARLAGARQLPVVDEALSRPRRRVAAERARCSTRSARSRRRGRQACSASVDYRNLGAEELGSVYESLLELHPELQRRRRHLRAHDRGRQRAQDDRLATTRPTSLISCLLDSALDPVLDEAAAKGEEAILDLKVCDPACGSGHFLVAAAHRIAKRLASARTGDDEPSPRRSGTRCATSSAAASTASTSTRWRSSSARSASGWRRSSPAGRSPSSTPTSSAATPCSARPPSC